MAYNGARYARSVEPRTAIASPAHLDGNILNGDSNVVRDRVFKYDRTRYGPFVFTSDYIQFVTHTAEIIARECCTCIFFQTQKKRERSNISMVFFFD